MMCRKRRTATSQAQTCTYDPFLAPPVLSSLSLALLVHQPVLEYVSTGYHLLHRLTVNLMSLSPSIVFDYPSHNFEGSLLSHGFEFAQFSLKYSQGSPPENWGMQKQLLPA